MRIFYEEMYAEFIRVLMKYGMDKKKAALSAKLFTDASQDGVYTHGLNRFPKFIKSVQNKTVEINNDATCIGTFGFVERWNGNKGPGNLNAYTCMSRAIELSKTKGFGVVALANTNHWMRPGAYGLMAAEQNCIGILWTNTIPNMPAWGGKNAKLGNNPLVIAIPHDDVPVLVDVAMSLYSYGKLELYQMRKQELPVMGGFNKKGEMTKNPSEILETHQVFPIGYWKGSGLSLVLDLIAAIISGGNTTYDIGKLPTETSLSQVFISISLDFFPDGKNIKKKITESLEDIKNSIPIDSSTSVRYPGEGIVKIREDNRKYGIPVDEQIWASVKAL